MAQNNGKANETKQYCISEGTAAMVNCLQELNNLTAHIADVAEKYGSRDVDEVMQPICKAANELQQAIIHELIADRITEAAAEMHITAV